MRQLNLVFQGGGVMGTAYAGALQCLPLEYRLRGVGGTSAGSIMALLATVKRRDNLRKILEDPDLCTRRRSYILPCC
jgi:predicted acylesterase/phospholipase RssA